MSCSLGSPGCCVNQAKPNIIPALLRAPTILPIRVPPFASYTATQAPNGLGGVLKNRIVRPWEIIDTNHAHPRDRNVLFDVRVAPEKR
jgi:hypothetical protein